MYLSGMETEGNLEALFLELTGSPEPSAGEGTFKGLGRMQ
jgi:hypothetical protein